MVQVMLRLLVRGPRHKKMYMIYCIMYKMLLFADM